MNVYNIRLVGARLVSWDGAQKVQRRWIGDPKGPTDTCLRRGAVAIRAPQISSFLPRISFSILNGAAYFSSESIFSKSKSTSCAEFQYSSSSHGLVLETNSANKWKITNTNCQKEFDNFENFRLLSKQQFPKHKSWFCHAHYCWVLHSWRRNFDPLIPQPIQPPPRHRLAKRDSPISTLFPYSDVEEDQDDISFPV